MTTIEQLKKTNPTLYQIHKWIVKIEAEGWGEIEFTVKSHDYKAKMVTMKAVKPKKKTIGKSMTKRIMIK